MGGRQSAPKGKEEVHPRELTVCEKWSRSEQGPEELCILLQGSNGWLECGETVTFFLRGLTSRERYQNCVSVLLEYFKNLQSQSELADMEGRELFTYYWQKLSHSFFLVDNFHESSIDVNMSARDRLWVLYECGGVEEGIQRGMFFGYPSILLGFSEFVRELVERQVLVVDVVKLMRLVVSVDRLQMMRAECEKLSRWLSKMEQERVLDDLRDVVDAKRIYLSVTEEFLQVDNADMASMLLRNMLLKGYVFEVDEWQYLLKVQLYAMFLYQLGKLSLTFKTFSLNTLSEIAAMFFSGRNIEDTPLLRRCFDILQHSSQKWNQVILDYCFSNQAHVSVLVRLVNLGYLQWTGSQRNFSGLLGKVVGGNSQMGRYGQQLQKLVLACEVQLAMKTRLQKLVKLVECLHVFGVHTAVEEIYGMVSCDISSCDNSSVLIYQQSILSLLQTLIQNFFTQSKIVDRQISIEGTKFSFINLYDLLQFLSFLRNYLTHGVISTAAVHQLLFKGLLQRAHYEQVRILLLEQNVQRFQVGVEGVQILIGQHLINMMTLHKIKGNDSAINTLMMVLGIDPKKQSHHYLSAYYRYFKYLQQKNIILPGEIRENVSIQHLYYIVQHFYNRLDNIDFDFLFTQLSCIRTSHCHIDQPFQATVTQQYLRFRVYFSNKCFGLGKNKMAGLIIQEVRGYEPPWLGGALMNILRENSNVDQKFANLIFEHCARGEDLQYLMRVQDKKKEIPSSSSRLSLKNIKKLGGSLQEQRYVFLSDQLVINEQQYINLVAEMTFDKDESFREEVQTFFKLLTAEPVRAFNYGVNYAKAVAFIVNFLMEGVRRGIIHNTRVMGYLVRFLYFRLVREDRNRGYVGFKEFVGKGMQDMVASVNFWSSLPSVDHQLLNSFKRAVRNYEASQLVTTQFLNLYVKYSNLFRFMFDQGDRKTQLLQIRQQPMNKTNAVVLKRLGDHMNVDLVELSVHELLAKVNSRQDVDEEGWNIVQKLVFWGEDEKVARTVAERLGQKVQKLAVLVILLQYLRESGSIYKGIISQHHLQILISLASVEQDNNLFGVVPQGFFNGSVRVEPCQPRGMLSDSHRRLVSQSGELTNIFVLSKALFFMYGCDEEIQKVVLGEFALRRNDSQQFQQLRKKIKAQTSQ